MKALDVLLRMARRPGFDGAVVWAPSADATRAAAAALAERLPAPVTVVELGGPFLRAEDARLLLEPLLGGRTLVVSAPLGGELAPHFVDRWSRWLEHPAGTVATVTENLTLRQAEAGAIPGRLVAVVATTDGRARDHRSLSVELDDADVAALARSTPRAPDALAGVPRPDHEPAIRDLCLLHARDPAGTPRRSLGALLESDAGPVTWTDLEELLAGGQSYRRWLEPLRLAGRLDDERWAFAHAAFELLRDRAPERPHGLTTAIHDSVWDVVWDFRRLDDDDRYVFRGHVDARWSLAPSLMRPADVATLLERVAATAAFIAELRACAPDVCGGDLGDDELLAIAQHYGFATPLLDFSRSLRVAAFFATHRAAGSSDDAIGIIYYLRRDMGQRADRTLEQRLTLGRFSLLDAARLHLGDLRVVEPQLPGSENRIARQQGVFIAGYEIRDLREIAIDRIRFRQRPGEIFEDPALGITAAGIYPPDSRIQELADGVRARLGAGEMMPALGAARLPGNPVVGAGGSLLFTHVHDAAGFFDDLRDSADAPQLDAIAEVFGRYFASARANADAGETSDASLPEPASLPIAVAVDALGGLTGTDPKRLWAAVFEELTPGPADGWLGRPAGPALEPQAPNERLALACALFLAAWEHLQHVGGDRARALVGQSRALVLE